MILLLQFRDYVCGLPQILDSGGFSEPARSKPEPDGPAGQLYNIAQDIAEQNNLWQDKSQIVPEMRGLLAEIIAGSAK